MKKGLYCKVFAVGIIVLFVGVSVSSAISVDTHSVIENEEECKECNEVDNADLIIVERLLDRVEVYSKLLLVLSNHYPELIYLNEELSNVISTLTEDLKNDEYTFTCYILSIYDSIITIIYIKFDIYRDNFIDNGNNLIVVILGIYLEILNYLHGLIWETGYYLNCDWIPPWYIP
jgi:hypothetical protein